MKFITLSTLFIIACSFAHAEMEAPKDELSFQEEPLDMEEQDERNLNFNRGGFGGSNFRGGGFRGGFGGGGFRGGGFRGGFGGGGGFRGGFGGGEGFRGGFGGGERFRGGGFRGGEFRGRGGERARRN